MSNDVSVWYDQFSSSQVKTSVNLRHYTVFNKVIKSGLKKDHNVLEIGCGIGTITGLLSNYLSKGNIVGVDISEVSIDIAKKRLSKMRNLELIVSDMSNFSHKLLFDFVILPDVLEHIPVELHENLFQTISKITHIDSKIIIHIPHHKALDYLRIHNPSALQIIDQSLDTSILLHDLYKSNFILTSFKSYSLYSNDFDYVYIEIGKNKDQNPKALSKSKIVLKKFFQRVLYYYNRIF